VKAGASERKWINQDLSDSFKDLVNQLLQFDPKERLGAKDWEEVKNHKFFKDAGFDWNALEKK
jgi:serine/threonine protein kinase